MASLPLSSETLGGVQPGAGVVADAEEVSHFAVVVELAGAVFEESDRRSSGSGEMGRGPGSHPTLDDRTVQGGRGEGDLGVVAHEGDGGELALEFGAHGTMKVDAEGLFS